MLRFLDSPYCFMNHHVKFEMEIMPKLMIGAISISYYQILSILIRYFNNNLNMNPKEPCSGCVFQVRYLYTMTVLITTKQLK